ncbi:MAG TPA: hypothetical protein VI386_09190 [Candidatus Sulfotelmatobacter sp.]
MDSDAEGLLVELGVGYFDASGTYRDGDSPDAWRSVEEQVQADEGREIVALLNLAACPDCGSTSRRRLLSPCSDESDPGQPSPSDWHYGLNTV